MPTFHAISPHDHQTAHNRVTECVGGVQSLIDAQALFSFAVFGLPDFRGPAAVLDHVRKEVEEIALAPMDAQEWADLVLLALDGLQRSCWLHNKQFAPAGSLAAPMSPRIELTDTMRRNFNREWSALEEQDPSRAVEHVRTPDEQAVKDAELPASFTDSVLGACAPLVRPEFAARPKGDPVLMPKPGVPRSLSHLHAWGAQVREHAASLGYDNVQEMLADAGLPMRIETSVNRTSVYVDGQFAGDHSGCPPYPPKGYDLEKCAAGVMAHFGLTDSEDLATAIQRHKSGGWAARDEAFRLHLTLNSAVQLAGYENLTHFTLSALANLGCIVPAEGDTL